MLFRAKEFSDVPLIRRALAEKLEVEKLTGIEFHEIEGFSFLTA
jgi:hypothetical protein